MWSLRIFAKDSTKSAPKRSYTNVSSSPVTPLLRPFRAAASDEKSICLGANYPRYAIGHHHQLPLEIWPRPPGLHTRERPQCLRLATGLCRKVMSDLHQSSWGGRCLPLYQPLIHDITSDRTRSGVTIKRMGRDVTRKQSLWGGRGRAVFISQSKQITTISKHIEYWGI